MTATTLVLSKKKFAQVYLAMAQSAVDKAHPDLTEVVRHEKIDNLLSVVSKLDHGRMVHWALAGSNFAAVSDLVYQLLDELQCFYCKCHHVC